MKMTQGELFDKGYNTYYSFQKPNACPHCGIYIESVDKLVSSADNIVLILFTCTVPTCKKVYYAVYEKGYVNANITNLDFNVTYPLPQMENMPKTLLDFSEPFANKCREAFTAEKVGHFELAACGYRNAVEALLKDYVVAYCGCNLSDKELRKLTIDKCIKDYLSDLDTTVSAYFTKVEGNKATHYPEVAGEEFCFIRFMTCFKMLIAALDGKVMIRQLAGELPPQHQQKFDLPVQSSSPPDEDVK